MDNSSKTWLMETKVKLKLIM